MNGSYKSKISICTLVIYPIFFPVMRRRRKRRRKYTQLKKEQTLNSKMHNRFENAGENNWIHSESNNCESKIVQTLNLIITKHNVSTQTESIHDSMKVSKDVAFQFPERVLIIPELQKRFRKPFLYNIRRQIFFCRSCRSRKRHSIRNNGKMSQSSPRRIGTAVWRISSAANILQQLGSKTLSITKRLINVFISICKLLDICLELGLEVKRKLSTKFEKNMNTRAQDNILNEKRNSLKQIFLDEFTKINNRLDCIEANQKHFENSIRTSAKAETTISHVVPFPSASPSVAIFVPPPPPMPPVQSPLHTPYKLNPKSIAKIGNGTKKSLSDISVSSTSKQNNNNTERIAITVEDLRNVKLRPRANKKIEKRPFISEQMLNGVKLRPTNVNVTLTDGGNKITPLERSIWKYNTL